MQAVRIAGSRPRRPSATTTANGKAKKMDSVASITVRGRPPHRSVRTSDRPNTPPPMRMKNSARMPTHMSASQGFQKKRTQLRTSPPIMSDVATRGRHCSSNGYRPNRMTRYFSVTTPQQAPMPRAAWHASESARTTASMKNQRMKPGSTQASRPSTNSVTSVLRQSANRLRRIQGTSPEFLSGEGRGAMGVNVSGMLIAP